MKLSDNIKFIRKENNLSQEQLAEQLGVSRQAVSKWESGQSYPEMDKVLLICKLYNYNIDELMNENVKEVSETNQSKININKYIDDFFEFITKTVDMLSSMKFKQKMKCFMDSRRNNHPLKPFRTQSRSILNTITIDEFRQKQNGCLPLKSGKHP